MISQLEFGFVREIDEEVKRNRLEALKKERRENYKFVGKTLGSVFGTIGIMVGSIYALSTPTKKLDDFLRKNREEKGIYRVPRDIAPSYGSPVFVVDGDKNGEIDYINETLFGTMGYAVLDINRKPTQKEINWYQNRK